MSTKTTDVPHALNSILSSNIPPTTEEALSIKALLKEEETTLTDTHTEITQLQVRLNALLENRGDSRTRVEQYQAALSSARILPPELVRRIFIECVADPSPRFTLSPNSLPLSLAQICSGWRDVSLSTPELWNHLAFHTDHLRGVGHFKELAQSWFSRCQMKPISLTFSTGLNPENIVGGPLLDIFLGSSKLIQHLDLSLHTDFFAAFSHFPEDAFLSLRSIRFSGTPVDARPVGGYKVWDSGTSAFQFAPNLSNVFFSIPHTIINLQELNFPWTQLTDLHLAESLVAPEYAIRVLAQCKKLTSCSLRLQPSNETLQAPDITLDTITNFSLRTEARELMTFLQHLTIPSLRSISIHVVPNATWETESFINLILRSECKLDHFSVSCSVVDADGFIQLLHSLPTVQVLDLMFISFMTDDVLTRMSPVTVHEEPPLPSLRVMRWREVSLKCSPGCIRNFIASRGWEDQTKLNFGKEVPKVARLESFEVKASVGHFGAEWDTYLAGFREQGLDLTYGL